MKDSRRGLLIKGAAAGATGWAAPAVIGIAAPAAAASGGTCITDCVVTGMGTGLRVTYSIAGQIPVPVVLLGTSPAVEVCASSAAVPVGLPVNVVNGTFCGSFDNGVPTNTPPVAAARADRAGVLLPPALGLPAISLSNVTASTELSQDCTCTATPRWCLQSATVLVGATAIPVTLGDDAPNQLTTVTVPPLVPTAKATLILNRQLLDATTGYVEQALYLRVETLAAPIVAVEIVIAESTTHALPACTVADDPDFPKDSESLC